MVNDKELFESSISETPEVVETPVESPVVEAAVDDGPVRDEQGRFAPKEAKAEPVAETLVAPIAAPAAKEPEAQVPSWRLREVTEEREAAVRRANDLETRTQAFEREMAEMRKQLQPKPEPVDFFTDPNAAFKQQLSPFEQQIQSMEQKFLMRASRAEAKSDYGKDAVEEMEKAIETAFQERHPGMTALSVQMRNSDHPVGVAMDWYRREKLLKETGGDITQYRTKLQDDLLKDPAFLAKAIEAVKLQASGQSSTQTQPTNLVQLPPSINRATSAASPHEEAGNMSNESLYAHATRR